jgi:hypothetical protein
MRSLALIEKIACPATLAGKVHPALHTARVAAPDNAVFRILQYQFCYLKPLELLFTDIILLRFFS